MLVLLADLLDPSFWCIPGCSWSRPSHRIAHSQSEHSGWSCTAKSWTSLHWNRPAKPLRCQTCDHWNLARKTTKGSPESSSTKDSGSCTTISARGKMPMKPVSRHLTRKTKILTSWSSSASPTMSNCGRALPGVDPEISEAMAGNSKAEEPPPVPVAIDVLLLEGKSRPQSPMENRGRHSQLIALSGCTPNPRTPDTEMSKNHSGDSGTKAPRRSC